MRRRRPLLLVAVAAVTADACELARTIGVRPVRLVRLTNSVFGAEHLVLLSRDAEAEDDDALLPTLLDFNQGSALEQQCTGAVDFFGVVGQVLARRDFFEAAAQQEVTLWQLAQLAQRGLPLTALLAAHLESYGLQPLRCELDAPGRRRGESAVRMRDMGAFTGAQPSSVRLDGGLEASLVCDDRRGVPLLRRSQRRVALAGVADAVLLATHYAPVLELRVPSALWDARAVAPARLPEAREEWPLA